ncbi:hypothetical protein [Curtobacterium sp. 20TX0008]|uniref:hypothetical protein n=1 Tax=Curtobacterium sp. 20TX0008 TaxID=3022018 RepID=UPI00232ABF20|nr:hypothetical protein [Curtobacterium sp. 20TX0008]MDB6427102.1 hypothetical protein [Curtobacterium sp. 20TX0008]
MASTLADLAPIANAVASIVPDHHRHAADDQRSAPLPPVHGEDRQDDADDGHCLHRGGDEDGL